MRLYEEALPYWPAYLGHLKKRPCPDGLGYELYDPNGLKEKYRVLVEAVKAATTPPTGLIAESDAVPHYREKFAALIKLVS